MSEKKKRRPSTREFSHKKGHCKPELAALPIRKKNAPVSGKKGNKLGANGGGPWTEGESFNAWQLAPELPVEKKKRRLRKCRAGTWKSAVQN